MRLRAALLPLAFVLLLTFAPASSQSKQDASRPAGPGPAPKAASADGLAAWQQVYSVLVHPRCLNCHTATDYPQQGDDRHRHLFNVVRGGAGFGVAGLNCQTCHQNENADSTGVPGAPRWHLAPRSMAWQTESDQPFSSSELCRALTDPAKNEHMDGTALLRHHREAPIVLWSFAPGRHPDGTMRTLPPMTHAEFVEATRRWVAAGTPCPAPAAAQGGK